MSRGLGKVERDVLALLAVYRQLGDVGLQRFGGTSLLRQIVLENAAKHPEGREAQKVALYRHGIILELARMRRELPYSSAVLSRALRSLDRKGLVALLAGDMEPILDHWLRGKPHVKHVGLTGEGIEAAAKCKLLQTNKVSA